MISPSKPTLIRNKSERGQSLVEFTFGAIVLIVLLVGMVDFGRAFYTYVALRDAAQEGAVYGSICPKNAANIEQRVRTSSSEPVDLTDTTHVKVTCRYVANNAACGSGSVPTPGTGIRVAVEYDDFMITMPFLGGLIGRQSITIRAEVEDTILRDIICP